MRIKDFAGALSDLEKQIGRYEKFAEYWYYKGLVLQMVNRQQEARACFNKARRLFLNEGYHFTDPYCEVTDAIYLSDIDEALAACK